MMRRFLALFLPTIMAFAAPPESHQTGWQLTKKGEVTFYVPPNAVIKEVVHDEGSIVSVFVRGLNKIRLEIKIGAGGCVLPMSKVIADNQDQIVFELKYKVGDRCRNDAVILSKHRQTICSAKYGDATPEEAEELDSIIKTITISNP